MMTTEQIHPLSEALHWAVGQAVQAPSLHNAQPWRFRIRGQGVEVRADRSRALPVIDADGRELATSCGAALFHLRIALRTKGLDVDVRRLPDPLDPDLIARVMVKPGQGPTEEELRLCAAIPTRRTSRAPYLGITVPDEVIDRLRRDAETEGAWFAPLTGEAQRVQLVALVMEADHLQWSNSELREEFARWMRPNDSSAHDGVPGYSLGLDNVQSHIAAMAVRLMDRGAQEAVAHRDLVAASPLLVILGTSGDEPIDWVRAGEALDRILLRAESEDLRVAFLNQPVETAELRPRVGELAGRPGSPQLILRIGYGAAGPGTPRRPVSEVLE